MSRRYWCCVADPERVPRPRRGIVNTVFAMSVSQINKAYLRHRSERFESSPGCQIYPRVLARFGHVR